jgi:hypothetical protein
MTTTLATMEANVRQLEGYRDGLKDEARRTVDATSRNDRLAEVARVNNQISRMLDRLDALEA